GVQPGDRLAMLGGNAVVDSESYRAALVALQPDEPTELVFARKDPEGVEQLVPLTLEGWTRIRRVLHERAGLTVDQVWLSGVHPRARVVSVQEGGPAALLGLRPDDVLDSLRVPGGRAWIISSPGNLAGLVWRVP